MPTLADQIRTVILEKRAVPVRGYVRRGPDGRMHHVSAHTRGVDRASAEGTVGDTMELTLPEDVVQERVTWNAHTPTVLARRKLSDALMLGDPGLHRKEANQAVSRMNKSFLRMVKEGKPTVRVDHIDVLSVLREGRLKNQHEVNDSNGLLRPEYRRDVENYFWGYGFREKGEARPIYGYMHSSEADQTNVTQYGMVQIRLKDEIRERCTVSWGDSLDSYPDVQPLPLDSRNLTAAIATEIVPSYLDPSPSNRAPMDFGWGDTEEQACYIEIQVHGGVTLDDIEEIVVSYEEMYEVARRGWFGFENPRNRKYWLANVFHKANEAHVPMWIETVDGKKISPKDFLKNPPDWWTKVWTDL